MGWFWRAVLLAVATCVQLGSAVAKPVATDAGALQGVRADHLTVYRGVPFAAPPVGGLRWREPQPVPPWEGVRKADAFAPACVQTGVSMPGEAPPAVSEDCLYLNIWTPARNPRAGLPVMVWVPGGGFVNGSAAMPLYWGDRLARKGVIVVTIAYRLGPFGFLAHPELTRKLTHAASGNYGLHGPDRRPALGATEHRRLRRRSGAGHHRRPVGGIDFGQPAAGFPPGEGPLPTRDWRKRRRVRGIANRARLSARQRRAGW